MWRARAVEEALALQDIDATDVPENKKGLCWCGCADIMGRPQETGKEGPGQGTELDRCLQLAAPQAQGI